MIDVDDKRLSVGMRFDETNVINSTDRKGMKYLLELTSGTG